ncbi:E3 ubiquitin-protein ligase, putative [Plasmodium gaboni]|uniref:E3 ubiquitin-protein ligase, putative n=1 Tax=Plasmodium gaboni TaxID=647221 RepID=A0ABY1UMR6_9APIC|nr:E3 ubiquitin-protein ligase, putative [Plasmodium gaboni]
MLYLRMNGDNKYVKNNSRHKEKNKLNNNIKEEKEILNINNSDVEVLNKTESCESCDISVSSPRNINEEKNKKKDNKKNKKGTKVNYLVNYNRYKPTRIHLFKKKCSYSYVKKNINQYINCNFRYYVKEKNYLIQNIDENIKWDQIEKVDYIIYDNTSLTCPICLENNIISPRITKCRHIFCFFCILKYFINEEKKIWKKCPICFDIISENDLRIVKFHYVKNYNINDKINLCLLYTENKKINIKSDRLDFNNNFNITNNYFIKDNKVINYKYFVNIDYMNENLTTVSQTHSEQILKLNLNSGIQFSKLFYIYNPLSIWIKDLSIFNLILTNKNFKFVASDDHVIEKAIAHIKFKISEYLNIPLDRLNPKLKIDQNNFDSFYLYDNLAHDVYESIEQIKNEMTLEMELTKNQRATNIKVPISNTNKKKNQDVTDSKDLNQIYFYQCIDGQCIFLDPFILNLLFYEYDQDMNKLPKFLCNKKITHIESFELDEKIRKRYAILSHLPLGVNVLFVSINIDDMLSNRTKEHFSKEIAVQKNKHLNIMKRKIKEEKYLKLLADEEINRKEKSYWNLTSNKIVMANTENCLNSSILRYSKEEGKKHFHGELNEQYSYEPSNEHSYDYLPDESYKYVTQHSYDYLPEQPYKEDNSCNNENLLLKRMIDIDHLNNKKEWNEHSNYMENKKSVNESSKKKKKKKSGGNKSNSISPRSNVEINNSNEKKVEVPKRSFLEIAKKKCDVNENKIQMEKKNDENLSIGSGPVNINLLDLINNKKSKKKKKNQVMELK